MCVGAMAILLVTPSAGRPQAATTGEVAATAHASGTLVLAGGGGKLQASMQMAEAAADRITIPMGTSRVLDLNLPIKRVEVAQPGIAQVTVLSPRQVLLGGYAVGSTQVILWDESGERLVLAVQVEPNLAQLKEAIKQVAPDADVDIRVVGEVLVLSGTVRSADIADRIQQLAAVVSPDVQNQMTVAGVQQVVLRCTVAEVSKSAVRSLGVDAWASFEDNSPVITANEVAGINPALIGPTAGLRGVGGTAFLGNRFLFGSDEGGFQIAQSSQSLQMELFVRALQDNGLLRILAEPNVVTLSGKKADFLVGGEFPVPVPQATGGGVTITIEWKKYGVVLEFLPTVIGQQMIRLTVAPEVSQIDFTSAVQIEGYTVPGVTQRRVETTIEVASGSTIAIAGLLSEEVRARVGKTPGLGDLPVLGALFRSVEYRSDLTELVILVTPELVSSMYPDQVPPVPGQNMTSPSDWQLYGLGRIEGDPVPAPADTSRTAALHTEIDPQYRKFASPPEQMSIRGPWGPAKASESVQ